MAVATVWPAAVAVGRRPLGKVVATVPLGTTGRRPATARGGTDPLRVAGGRLGRRDGRPYNRLAGAGVETGPLPGRGTLPPGLLGDAAPIGRAPSTDAVPPVSVVEVAVTAETPTPPPDDADRDDRPDLPRPAGRAGLGATDEVASGPPRGAGPGRPGAPPDLPGRPETRATTARPPKARRLAGVTAVAATALDVVPRQPKIRYEVPGPVTGRRVRRPSPAAGRVGPRYAGLGAAPTVDKETRRPGRPGRRPPKKADPPDTAGATAPGAVVTGGVEGGLPRVRAPARREGRACRPASAGDVAHAPPGLARLRPPPSGRGARGVRAPSRTAWGCPGFVARQAGDSAVAFREKPYLWCCIPPCVIPFLLVVVTCTHDVAAVDVASPTTFA